MPMRLSLTLRSVRTRATACMLGFALALALACAPVRAQPSATLYATPPPTLPPLGGADTTDRPGEAPGTRWALALADAALRIAQNPCAPCVALAAEVDALPLPATHERLRDRLLDALRVKDRDGTHSLAPCMQLVFYAVHSLVDEDRARALVARTRPTHCP